MAKRMTRQALRQALTDGEEVALLDVRERGRYSAGHLFLAVNTPLSQLELVMRSRVPRSSARVIVCDDLEGLADPAARVMEEAGYSDVSVLDASMEDCTRAGFQVFQGHYATTYALGLHAAERYGVPQIDAESLKSKLDAGEDLIVVDTRTQGEYNRGCVPSAISAPLVELIYRIRDLAPDPETQVVVNCGAVTRGVLGCQSLIEAGIENPVSVLTNGARGWHIAGFALETGAERTYPAVSDNAKSWSVEALKRISAGVSVTYVTPAELEAWREQRAERTLYLVDVRSFEEYQAGHIEDSIWIPGGQLIGLYEDYLATLNARVCLIDDNGARATVAASWLKRMGWPAVTVLTSGLDHYPLVKDTTLPLIPELESLDVPTITPSDLRARISKQQVLVIDCGASTAYQSGHIPGAWWTIRSSLPRLLGGLPSAPAYVATSEDGQVARLAAGDLLKLTEVPVMTLSSGTGAWASEGFELIEGLTRILGELDDVHAAFGVRPGDDPTTVTATQLRMGDWQNGLLPKIDQDQTFSFPEMQDS